MEDFLDKPEAPESSEGSKISTDRTEGAGGKVGGDSTKPTLRDRFAYPLMLVVGVVAAGLISFLVQSGTLPWFSGQTHKIAASSAPGNVPVVYINTGKIMADVIKTQVDSGTMTRHEAAEMGHVIGQTIQEVAAHYARQGDLVLSRNVLAAPQGNNVTAIAEKIVKARLAEEFSGG